jgi:hypothetical protein
LFGAPGHTLMARVLISGWTKLSIEFISKRYKGEDDPVSILLLNIVFLDHVDPELFHG